MADLPQGSYKSRKFFLTVFGLILLTLVSLAAIWFPTVAAILPTFIGGVLGVLSLYFTGNVMTKHVTGSNIAKIQKASSSEHEKEM